MEAQSMSWLSDFQKVCFDIKIGAGSKSKLTVGESRQNGFFVSPIR